MFLDGALRWASAGFNINEQHTRQAPIVRAIPYLDGKAIKIDAAVPDTQRGRDAITNIREGVYTGLSVEFYAEQEEYRQSMRVIKRGILGGAALVDRASYGGSVVEVPRTSGHSREPEGLPMAVTLTIHELLPAMRLTASIMETPDPAIASIVLNMLDVATAQIEEYAPWRQRPFRTSRQYVTAAGCGK